MPTKNIDLPSLIEKFGSEDKCHAYLERLRWPDGVRCPRCQSEKISRIHTRRMYECDSCRYQFSVRVGTIFHDSKLPIWKWMLAVYMITQSKKGISSNQLKRMLGVSYKTAWYLTHRIRAAMAQTQGNSMLSGIVEVDETFVGGKVRGRGMGYKGNKAIVIGAVQRGGKIRLGVIKDRSKKSMHAFIEKHVDDDTEAIFTDEHHSYKGIADDNTMHKTVNHSQNEWVVGDVHTNSIENVWSLLKRSINGTYHKLSIKHLPAYLQELSFRFNNRDNDYLFRDTILALIHANQLQYKKLVA